MPALHLLAYSFGPRFGVTSTGGRVRFVAASGSLPDVRDSLTVGPIGTVGSGAGQLTAPTAENR
jgi:hypothetical protein